MDKIVALTDDEFRFLRTMVICWVEEGFTVPPYRPEVYGILEKLDIAQEDIGQPYDITPPAKAPGAGR